MDWDVARKVYLALSGFFNNLVNFFANIGKGLNW